MALVGLPLEPPIQRNGPEAGESDSDHAGNDEHPATVATKPSEQTELQHDKESVESHCVVRDSIEKALEDQYVGDDPWGKQQSQNRLDVVHGGYQR